MTETQDWKAMANTNPQGAVLCFLRENRTVGGIHGHWWTAREIAEELGLRVAVVREQLNIWLEANTVAISYCRSRSGARLWRAI